MLIGDVGLKIGMQIFAGSCIISYRQLQLYDTKIGI